VNSWRNWSAAFLAATSCNRERISVICEHLADVGNRRNGGSQQTLLAPHPRAQRAGHQLVGIEKVWGCNRRLHGWKPHANAAVMPLRVRKIAPGVPPSRSYGAAAPQQLIAVAAGHHHVADHADRAAAPGLPPQPWSPSLAVVNIKGPRPPGRCPGRRCADPVRHRPASSRPAAGRFNGCL